MNLTKATFLLRHVTVSTESYAFNPIRKYPISDVQEPVISASPCAMSKSTTSMQLFIRIFDTQNFINSEIVTFLFALANNLAKTHIFTRHLVPCFLSGLVHVQIIIITRQDARDYDGFTKYRKCQMHLFFFLLAPPMNIDHSS